MQQASETAATARGVIGVRCQRFSSSKAKRVVDRLRFLCCCFFSDPQDWQASQALLLAAADDMRDVHNPISMDC
jgi:hypothetical protein